MKNLFILLTSLILIISSCSKEKIIPYTVDQRFFLSNTVNPFDDDGVFHNNSLDYIASNCNINTVTGPEFFSNLFDYWETVDSDFNPNCTNIEASTHFDNIYQPNQSFPDLLLVSFNSNEISEMQKNYLLKLDTLINNYGNNYSVMAEKIGDLETELSDEDRLNESEKELVWGCISVADFSGLYWSDWGTNPNHPYASLFEEGNCKPHVIIEDIKGYFYGWHNPIGNTSHRQSAKQNMGRSSHQAAIQ